MTRDQCFKHLGGENVDVLRSPAYNTSSPNYNLMLSTLILISIEFESNLMKSKNSKIELLDSLIDLISTNTMIDLTEEQIANGLLLYRLDWF